MQRTLARYYYPVDLDRFKVAFLSVQSFASDRLRMLHPRFIVSGATPDEDFPIPTDFEHTSPRRRGFQRNHRMPRLLSTQEYRWSLYSIFISAVRGAARVTVT